METVGRSAKKVPGGGAIGNMMERHTPEWSSPKTWPSSCPRMDSRSYAPGEFASAAGVAKVAWPSLRMNMSASMICPAKREVSAVPKDCPGASAIISRVKESTPVVNAAEDWLKQIVLMPSTFERPSFVQAFCTEVRPSGPSALGNWEALRSVPETPVHISYACVMAEIGRA